MADFPGERVFEAATPVKHVLQDADIDAGALVVAFSGDHPPDVTPRYYNHKALRGLACPRMFVLDDQGPREPLPRPCWYLGKDRVFDVAESVLELMTAVTGELGVSRRRVITCGGSKGGWAALYFGARFGAGHAVAGEPQVVLGKHICWSYPTIAAHVAGDASRESSDFLDGLLFDAFRRSPNPPEVDLFSGRTDYLERDVLPLRDSLDELGVPCRLELAEHTRHVPDHGKAYPPYLRRRLEEILAG
ncbi:MAG TPA: hypothetical protein VGF21_16935 [Thermoleophilaceae bacterium]